MTATFSEATDDIFTLFNTAWQANTAAIVGSVPQIYWPDTPSDEPPASESYWAVITSSPVTEKQSTLRIGVAPTDKQRYTVVGLVEIEIYCPMSEAGSLARGRSLAEIARNAFRGKHSDNGVWFRDVRIAVLPPSRDWHRLSVTAEYRHDDIG